MKKIFFLLFFVSSFPYISKAQYVNEDYKYSYVIKIQGVFCQGDAKNINLSLSQLFDSKHQNYNSIDSTITILSAVDITNAIASDKLNSYGFQLLSFLKKEYAIIRKEETQK
jgi:hypothetical protein